MSACNHARCVQKAACHMCGQRRFGAHRLGLPAVCPPRPAAAAFARILSLSPRALSTAFRLGTYGKGAYQRAQYRDLIGEGIFNSNPPEWRCQRRAAAPLFTTKALKAHGQQSRPPIEIARGVKMKSSGGVRLHSTVGADAVPPLTVAAYVSLRSLPSPLLHFRASTLSYPLLMHPAVSVFSRHASVLCRELRRQSALAASDPLCSYATRGIDLQEMFLRFTLDSFSEIGFGDECMGAITADDPAMHAAATERAHRQSRESNAARAIEGEYPSADDASYSPPIAACSASALSAGPSGEIAGRSPSSSFGSSFDFVQSACFRRMDLGPWWPIVEWCTPRSRRTLDSHLLTLRSTVQRCIDRAKARTRVQWEEKQRRRPDLLTQTLLDMTGQ
jgi:hypothetical protein